MMPKQTAFFGGVPTEPDVNRIRAAYPDSKLDVGAEIPYQSISEVIRTAIDDSRFRTVTTRWRKLVEHESGKVIKSTGGKFVILSDNQKVDLVYDKLRSGVRQIKRSAVVSGRTERKNITEENARRLDHADRVTASIQSTARLISKTPAPALVTNGEKA